MNLKLTLTTLVIFLSSFATTFGAELQKFDSFGKITILAQGRHKPVDTYARNLLLSVYHKSSIKIDGKKEPAIRWLANLMTNPTASYDREDIKVHNNQVIDALGITRNDEFLYTFWDLREGFQKIMPELTKWYEKSKDERSLVEHQLVELFMKIMNYYQVSRSLSGFFHDLSIEDPALAAEFELQPNQKVSYLHFIERNEKLRSLVAPLQNMGDGAMSDKDRKLMALLQQLSSKFQDQQAQQLQIIPALEEGLAWSAPWKLMGQLPRAVTDFEMARLRELQNMTDAMIAGDVKKLDTAVESFVSEVGHRDKIDYEITFNNTKPFTYSNTFYIISFVLLLFSWIIAPKWLYLFSSITVGLGWLLHLVGICSRMYIMSRPPVSTLYESIIFVGLISVTLCLIVEYLRKNGIGIFSATVIGIILHFIGFSYASEGDTMGMLVAVLNSNFWLGTHVVTISMGYGCALVAGLVGHLYLFQAILKPNNKERLKEINNNMVGLTLVALLFTTVGTILGGIWADQSWGRFWGWDPKENGAMLICLVLMVLLHGRISGVLRPAGYAFGLVINNIVVALAWFGVNLLNVGLHNYGFTESIAYNLSVFCGIEIFLGGVSYAIVKLKQKPSASAA